MKIYLTLSFTFSLLLTPFLQDALADKLVCAKNSLPVKDGTVSFASGIKVVATTSCPRGYKQVLSTSSLKGSEGSIGPQGPIGGTGLDGKRMIYGDGSAGDRVISSDDYFDEIYFQFKNFTIEAGVKVTVPNGTVIRCTGTFTNNGILEVEPNYGTPYAIGSGVRFHSIPPHPGIGSTGAQNGYVSDDSGSSIPGAYGGGGLRIGEARNLLHPPLVAGGQGGATLSWGRPGGGSLTIIAQDAISIGTTGSILVNGYDPLPRVGAGSGGGVLILASRTVVKLAAGASLEAKGSSGQGAENNAGATGGGGGGLIHILAPLVDDDGAQLDVSGGAAGSQGTPGMITANPRSGGAGGGGSCGSGGRGASVDNTTDSSDQAEAGGDGCVFKTDVDPTGLF